MFAEFSVNKTVPLRFAGHDLRLKTTHALFSSHHVDDGTMLLLKTLAQQSSVPASGRALDAGCGVGPLAVAIKTHRPSLQVTARDRLVLAAEYTAENARLNGVVVDAQPGLLLEDSPGPWDLIVSNLPAKAGEPVLKDFVSRSAALLSPAGVAAVVVVEPLADGLAQCIQSAAELVYQEEAPGYRVFHYRSRPGTELGEGPFPSAYRRGQMEWKAGSQRFLQKTFYGLPNFDALDYRHQATLAILEGLTLKGDCLVWEPVQGHLAVWAAAHMSAESVLSIAGNDMLSLAAAAENCHPRPVNTHPAAWFSDLELGAMGTVLAQLHPEPQVAWAESMASSLWKMLAPGGNAIVNGRSTDVARLLEHRVGWRVVRDRRLRGWRSVLIRKNG